MTSTMATQAVRVLPPDPTEAEEAGAAGGHGAARDYRPDVDGLRGIAVALTVLFHLHVGDFFAGGFVGVDVFFVISGYLITGLVLQALRDGTFSLVWFYERRVRRIVPALAALVALVLAGGWVLLLPGDYRQTARSALWALGAVSNLFFLDNTGYFDAAATSMPLLHTWSLAVEEQFYLVWPLLLVLLFKAGRGNARVLGLGLVAVVIASFLVNVREVETAPKAAFFLLKARAWELGAGGLLSLWPALGPGRAWRRVAEVLPALGLTLIAWAALTLSSEASYPGWHGLLPVAGAMLIVYESGHRTLTRRLLGTRPLVFVGTISYSLYLLSWPLTVYWRLYTNGTTPTPTAACVLVGVSVVLAWASWRWVEQPFRRPTLPRRAVFLRAATAVLVLIVAARAVVASDGVIGRIPEKARGLGDLAVMWEWSCPQKVALGLSAFYGAPRAREACVVGTSWESARTRALLWGDSFAEHLLPILDPAAREAGTAVALVNPCPPVFDDATLRRHWPTLPRYNALCATQNADTFRFLEEHDDVRIVLLTASWASLVGLLQDERGAQIPRSEGMGLMADALVGVLSRIVAPGRRVVLVADTPRLPMPDPASCAVARVSPLLRDCPPDLGLVAWQNLTSAVMPTHRMLAEVVRRSPGTTLYLPEDHLCAEPRCDVELNGEFLYRDGGHLRRNLTPETRQALAERMRFADLLEAPVAGVDIPG